MDPEKLAKIEEIYHVVSQIPSKEQASFLSNMCGGDKELRREVESLLYFAERPSDLIDKPPLDVAAEIFSGKNNSEMIGEKIGHYKILSQIGGGGMGEVFLAEDIELERRAAVKFIRAEFARDPEQLRRFLREAKTASSLNHPNIITVYEIGKTKTAHYIAAEFIEGETLRARINDNSLSLVDMLDVAAQIATALCAAHAAGILHRDIKPENIMLREDKLVKVLDFGLAKLQEKDKAGNGKSQPEKNSSVGSSSQLRLFAPSKAITAPGAVMGTAAYMSPEQARMELIDARTDIWSLGVVLYEMCAGNKPFEGNTSGEIIESILKNKPSALRQNVPHALKQIIAKALEKNADERYQKMQDLLGDIENLHKKVSVENDLKLNTAPHRPNATSPNRPKDSTNDYAPNETGRSRKVQTRSVSSAEYIVRKVKSHKIFAYGFLAFVLAAFVLGSYFHSAGNSNPADSIAVLPFINETGDPNLEYLSDGISESLIGSLSQLSDVKVIAGSSTFRYKGKQSETQEISRALGVKFILSGRVFVRGDDLRISAELIDASDRTRIWGERFERSKTEIPDIETEIAQKIAERMKIHLTGGELEQFVKERKLDPQAYEFYLKGRFYQTKGSLEGLQKAVKHYERAIEIEPRYAKAYAALANIYLNMGANSFRDPKEMMPKAKASAQRALELDEDLAEVHLTLADIEKAEWNWAQAERSYRRAIKLDPNLAAVYFSYAFYLSTQRRHEEAISAIKKARRLDPLKPQINTDIAYIYYFARQYEPASEQYAISLELKPNYGPTYYGIGFVNAATGQFAEAAANYRKMIDLHGDHTGVKCYLGFALARSGRISEAKAILDELENGKEYVSPVELAILYTGLDEKEKALSTLERAYAEHDSQIQFLNTEPHFDGLRKEARFQDLLRRAGLE